MATTTVHLSRRAPLLAGRRPGLRLPLALGVLALVGLVSVAITRPSGTNATTGGPAPFFTLDDVRTPGTAVTLAPGQPVVVNFFAAWCVPCRKELPLLQQASQRTTGVAFVGVDVNDSRTAAGDLLDAAGITYPTGYDPDQSVADSYKLQGMPTTVFIDATGRVASVAKGQLSAAELDRRLDDLRPAAGVGTK